MKLLMGLVFFIISATATANAQTNNLKDLAGYVDFGELSSVYGEPKVRINIGKKLLWFVGLVAKHGDKDVAELLKKLDGVRVEVYKLDHNTDAAVNVVKDVSAQLQARDWEPIISIQEEDEQVRIYVKMSEEEINGLVVMVVKPGDEAVFINIIGDIDPAQVGKVTQALDIDLDI